MENRKKSTAVALTCDAIPGYDTGCRRGCWLRLRGVRLTFFCLLAFAVLPSISRAQLPVFEIIPEGSSAKFFVKASVALEGTFEKWDATLTFTSTDVTSGVLDIKIHADSV